MKKIMLALTALVMLVACGKDDDTSSTTIAEGTYPKKVTSKDKDGKVESITNYIFADGKIQRIESESYDEEGTIEERETMALTYEGDLPIKAVSTSNITSESYVTEYTYNNKKLQKSVETSLTQVETSEYSYNSNGRLETVKNSRYDISNVNRKYHYDYTYSYNGNTITETYKSYTTENGVETGSSSTGNRTYTYENDNLVKIVEQYSNSTTTYQYTYDAKNNPSYQNIMKVITPDYFTDTYFSKNNVTQEVRTSTNGTPEITVHEYEYNAKGYPIKETTKRNSEISSIIEYEY